MINSKQFDYGNWHCDASCVEYDHGKFSASAICRKRSAPKGPDGFNSSAARDVSIKLPGAFDTSEDAYTALTKQITARIDSGDM